MTFAQEIAPSTTFAGSADSYYKHDFSGQIDQPVSSSFTNSSSSFQLGMASIEATHKFKKGAVFVDLGFGNRASEFSYNDQSDTFMIKQLTFAYDVSDKLKVTMGSFGTHLGYELVDAIDNKNYSMSYAFTNGPFFNTGIKAQYLLGKFSVMAGVTNTTDFKSAIDAGGSTNKTFIAQLGYVEETSIAYFNMTTGSNNPLSNKNTNQFDIVATKKLSNKCAVTINATYASITDDIDRNLNGAWYSVVGYASYEIRENLNMSYRIEYFDDKAALSASAINGKILGNTLSLNYKSGNLTIIPEFRFDKSSQEVFLKNDLEHSKSNTYILLATTYLF